MQTVLDGRYAADRSVVALGMFDGVHIGHQVLLKKGRALADRQGVPLVTCTFMDHPLQLIAPDKCPPMLTTFDERVRLMESLGVDVLYAMPFDRSVMDMPPEDYIPRMWYAAITIPLARRARERRPCWRRWAMHWDFQPQWCPKSR